MRRVIEWLLLIAVSVAAALVVKAYAVEAYVVPSVSMVPTIQSGERILVNKLPFEFGDSPPQGAIVVFHRAPADPETDTPVLVKRVVGLPGDDLRSGPHGEIFVNGRLLRQPWLSAAAHGSPGADICAPGLNLTDCHDGVLHLPAGQYYVMGDNRSDSFDSRFWGPVSRNLLIGQVFVRIWPLDRVHWF